MFQYVVALFLSFSVLPQEVQKDSSSIWDSIDLGKTYFYSDPGRAKKIFFRTLKKVQSLEFKNGERGCYGNLARLYSYYGVTDSSLIYAKKSLLAAVDHKDSLIIGKSYYNLGVAYMRNDSYHLAIKNFTMATTFYDKENYFEGIVKVHQNISEIYKEVGLNNKVIKHTAIALKYARRLNDAALIVANTLNLSEHYLKANQLDSSFYYSGVAKENMENIHDTLAKNSMSMFLYLNLSDYYRAKGNGPLAIENAKKAKEQTKKLANRPIRILAASIKTAEAYLADNNLKEAEINYLQSLELAKQLEAKSELLIIYKALASLFSEKKKFKEAQGFFERYITLNDSLKSEKQTQLLAFYSQELENSMKDKEIAQQNLVIKNQETELYKKNTRYMYVIFFIVLAALTLFSLFQYRTKIYKNKINALLKKKNKELFKSHRKLRELSRAKTIFLNSVTHDLRTPLNTIINAIHLINNKEIKETERMYLDLLDDSGNYLLNYVDNIIAINNFEDGAKDTLEHKVFNLKNTLDKMFKLKVDTENNLCVFLDKNIPNLVLGDEAKFKQLLFNLVDVLLKNTLKCKIDLNVTTKALCKDNAGIDFNLRIDHFRTPPPEFSAILDCLAHSDQKIDTTDKVLNIKQKIIRQRLNLFKSQPEIVNEVFKTIINFTIVFKLRPEDSTTKNCAKEVLLVEDNKVNQMITKRMLTNKGYHCDTADDGLQAILKVRHKNYNLILLDIMMPRLDGFEAAKQIYKIHPMANIVALTSLSYKGNENRFDNCNIKHVLSKPLTVEKLFKTIDEVLV